MRKLSEILEDLTCLLDNKAFVFTDEELDILENLQEELYQYMDKEE